MIPLSDVIIFQEQDAFLQLMEHGVVATFRGNRRATPFGKCWIARKRGGHKVTDGRIIEVEHKVVPNKEGLKPYAQLSGFDTWTEWRRAIGRQHGTVYGDDRPEDLYNASVGEGYIYLVRATKLECYTCFKHPRQEHSPAVQTKASGDYEPWGPVDSSEDSGGDNEQ